MTQPTIYVVFGCLATTATNGNGPCVTAQWITAATRVKAMRTPVLLQNSQAICTPTGTGLKVAMTQVRVKGV